MQFSVSRIAALCLAVSGLFYVPASAQAQSQSRAQADIAIDIGAITSTRTCQYWREYEGSYASAFDAEYRRAWGLRSARVSGETTASWRSWVVQDCQTNFATLRSSLQAALASSDRMTVRPGAYEIDVTISDISETPPARSRPVRGDNAFHTSWGTASANVSYVVRAPNGDIIDGGNIRKQIEMGRTLNTQELALRTMEPGEAVYDLMQQEVADAVARAVAFDIDPIIVTAVEGYQIEVNYGAPLLSLGDILLVDRSTGIGPLRYRVTSSASGRAVAEMDGDNDPSDIAPGAEATFVEADSDAANGRRYRRSRLP